MIRTPGSPERSSRWRSRVTTKSTRPANTAARGEDASEWGRAIIETEVRRDLAAIQLREQLLAAKPGSLSEEASIDLVNEAKRATRVR